MIQNWHNCKNIICIRPDNMGDLLMSGPAIRALKETFSCRITVLTSSLGAKIVPFMPEIDDVIEFDVPWVKTETSSSTQQVYDMVEEIRKHQFDAAVIFTVYSQNALPSVMLAYLAGIPFRLAYCRENPYGLLTHWIPDAEPYAFIQHQVRRDLALVATVGAFTRDEYLSVRLNENIWPEIEQKLIQTGVQINRPWLVVHAGVSEAKRQYPLNLWIEACKRLSDEFGFQLLFTGVQSEKTLTDAIAAGVGANAFSVAGLLALEEFMLVIQKSILTISVNTSTVHIAAALHTPVIVLYALTNPQHAPWKAKGKVLLFDVPEDMRSKNEVVRFVQEQMHPHAGLVIPGDIVQAVSDLLEGPGAYLIPEMIPLRTQVEKAF